MKTIHTMHELIGGKLLLPNSSISIHCDTGQLSPEGYQLVYFSLIIKALPRASQVQNKILFPVCQARWSQFASSEVFHQQAKKSKNNMIHDSDLSSSPMTL